MPGDKIINLAALQINEKWELSSSPEDDFWIHLNCFVLMFEDEEEEAELDGYN